MKATTSTVTLSIIGGILLLVLMMAGCPQYRVYIASKHGEAELNRASYNRKIRVLEAEAEREAAKALAERDTIQAIGVARANAIIGNSLKNNEAYLYYLWIKELQGNQNAIYVPTEANLPILEAGRFGKVQFNKDTVEQK